MSAPPTSWIKSLSARPWALRKLGWTRERLDAVSMQLGHDESSIRVAACADGRVTLSLGTGEAFDGFHRDMPSAVGVAARDLVAAAENLVVALPRRNHESASTDSLVRFTLHTSLAVYVESPRAGSLKTGESPLAPLWVAGARLVSPMLVFLFKMDFSRHRIPCEVPALAFARRILPR